MQKKPIKHILVVRLSALGDVAMTVPVIKALLQQHPQLKVTILSRGFFKPLFHDIPNLHFHEADVREKHKGAFGLNRLSRELLKLNIDAVADLHNVLRSNILKTFLRLNKIPVVQIDKGRKEKKALTSGKKFYQLKTTHERYAEVFESLGFDIDLSGSLFSKRRELNEKISGFIGGDGKKWIGIAPFAAFKGKMYPLDLMEKVIETLNAAGAYQVILFGGGKKEENLLDAIAGKYNNVVNMAGKFSFEEELTLISNLDLMLSMDSGNAHLAAMYGIKTITLWGVTHPYAGFYPFKQDKNNALLSDKEKYPLIPTSVYGNKLPKGYEDVMRTISPEKVVEKIVSVI
ncbi:glycosyltransferase family 9 protein [Abyssalbus ytuae]|uniref:Glycosyltransferase family 9 protein n=1 Tax=Abyssalbus ytuae TaxID=2926907 RepID=A0A9E6ZX96_9FLAO|nr:glycosyltransferase family 9 protein [Abyssalbus ytuae]UOB19438.1 glycosyltransferase family 9 protein [Abyssalbus ytuae]